MKRLNAAVLALTLLCPLLPITAFAGWDEGVAAYDKSNYAVALREFQPLAVQGEARAQSYLGFMYANGQGAPQDHKEAVKWFRLAAEQGEARAQFYLGVMYANGQGVPQDYKEAFKWTRLVAEQGIASGQYNLGLMYANGRGVPQDHKEAVKWYRLAAEQGDASAQYNLGLMYYNGRGVPQSRVMAYALYNLSAAGDPSSDNKATANRAGLAESMGNAEIEAAQALTRELVKPKNFLKALDQYAKKPNVKEKPQAKPVAAGG